MSNNLHNSIIINLLKASFTKFYNINLTGRLMNRLSKDIYNIDFLLPDLINQIISIIFGLISLLLIFFVSGAYIMLPPLFVYIVVAFYFGYVYMISMREVTRLEAMSKSPILSYFSEIVRGAVYVRTCVNNAFVNFIHSNNIDLDLRNGLFKGGLENFFLAYLVYFNLICVDAMFVLAYFASISPDKVVIFMLLGTGVSGTLLGFLFTWCSL